MLSRHSLFYLSILFIAFHAAAVQPSTTFAEETDIDWEHLNSTTIVLVAPASFGNATAQQLQSIPDKVRSRCDFSFPAPPLASALVFPGHSAIFERTPKLSITLCFLTVSLSDPASLGNGSCYFLFGSLYGDLHSFLFRSNRRLAGCSRSSLLLFQTQCASWLSRHHSFEVSLVSHLEASKLDASSVR